MIKFKPKKVKSLAEYIAEKSEKETKNDDKLVKVKNLGEDPKDDTDYIHQWEKYKHRKAVKCANHDCKNPNSHPTLVGAHVIKCGDSDKAWYICPMCHKCNSDGNTDEMTVSKDDLAPYAEIKDL